MLCHSVLAILVNTASASIIKWELCHKRNIQVEFLPLPILFGHNDVNMQAS